MPRHYSREDVTFHSDGYRPSRPAVDIKVRGTLEQGYAEFVRDEEPDARFTLEWIEDNVSEDTLDAIFWHVSAAEFEYLTAYALEDDDAIFPADVYGRVTIEQEGRSGGWAAVDGLPDLDEWDAVLLARWRKFERVAREIANGVMHNVVASLYLNEWETAEAARIEDAGVEADVAAELATH